MKATISPIVKRIPFVGALIDLHSMYLYSKNQYFGKAAFKAIGAGLGAWIGRSNWNTGFPFHLLELPSAHS